MQFDGTKEIMYIINIIRGAKQQDYQKQPQVQ